MVRRRGRWVRVLSRSEVSPRPRVSRMAVDESISMGVPRKVDTGKQISDGMESLQWMVLITSTQLPLGVFC